MLDSTHLDAGLHTVGDTIVMFNWLSPTGWKVNLGFRRSMIIKAGKDFLKWENSGVLYDFDMGKGLCMKTTERSPSVIIISRRHRFGQSQEEKITY